MSKPATLSNGFKGSKRVRTALMLSGGVLALMTATPALGDTGATELPTGGTVVGGSATIGTPTPSSMLITQTTNRAVIDWSTFNIGQNAEVAFDQPNASAIALNRVVGGTAPSEIAGHLSSNGIVAVLNANGVLFAGTADVNVGGLIASTGQIDTSDFMAGGNTLAVTGANGGEIIVSAGANISIANAGLGAFVAPSVRNSGTITATAGRVQLGAGTAFTLDLGSDGLLQIGVGADSPLVENLGSVFATGGQIQLSARQASALVDQTIHTGVLPVGSARLDGNTIVLDATGSDVQLTSNITGNGNLTLSGSHIYGTGDINVDGNLTLNVNAGGAVADTSAGGSNWINDALGVIGAPVDSTTINLGAGLYRPGTVINASNVALDGQGEARIGWVSGIENAIDVWGDNVAIRNLEISGPATSGYASYAWGATNSRGIFVNRFADNVSLTNNNIHDIRTGVIVDGRNVGTVVTGNRIDNTKSAISVQYTDGSNVNLSGNFAGDRGNEWGINVHLNGILQGDGTTINPSTSSASGLPVGVLGTASLTEQQRLLALRDANGGMAVQNIAYSGANRTRAFVSAGSPTNTQGSPLSPLGTIQAGINAVVTGGTVNVANGTYNIGSTPISITKSLTLIGQSQAGVIIDGRGVGAGLGTMQVQADNVSLSNFTLYGADNGASNYGIKVQPKSSGGAYSPDQRLYNFAISDVTVRGSTRAELDLNGVIGATITNFTADGRRVANDAPTAGAGVQITDSSDITLSGVHTLGNTWGGVALYQSNKPGAYNGHTTNINIDAGQNTFDEALGLFTQLESATQTFGQLNLTGFNYAVRNTDHRPDDLDGQFTFYRTSLEDAVAFAKGVGNASASSIEGYTGTAFSNVFTVADGLSINSAVRDVRSGGTINVGNGTYNLGSTPISITKSLSLIGESEAGVIIDGRAAGSNGLGTIQVQADNVSLSNFTLYGSETSLGNYGIKVQPNPAGHVNTPGGDDQRVYNFAIDQVTVRGSRRAELDLNGVVGASISNFTADGRRVADDAETAGAGVQITDSADVTLNGVHTLGNTWGGVALYQSNKSSAYDGQTTNINIDASANQFDEAQGLFTQLESTTQGFGQLNLTGFNYAVRNTDHRDDDLDGQFTFYRTSVEDAVAFAKSVGNASASSIEGYTGTAFNNVFTVADGLSINSALRDVRAGGTVNVGAGTYAETVGIGKTLTLNGAGMDATSITGGMLITGSPSGLVLRDFAVSGTGNGSAVINNSGTITGLTVDGVRIDGENVANRHGFIGGQIGGDIAITDSEFRNIRGWAAFDTRSGAGGNDGAQITSGVFSNNLIDNTIGHIAFRQQIGATTLPDIVFAGNTLRNVGNATNSFGAIFKAFNADQVDFTGNNASGVGTSGFNPTGEAAYGAVLMTRGTAVLNVTGNTFANNNQVFAVEPGRGLPGVTNFAGNTFTNNAYSIYLPGTVAGAGTINFGAGNNFVAGADTLRHIVWRSASGLDLTGVSFGGTLASNLTLDQAFAAADLITDGIDLSGAGLARLSANQLYVTTGSGTDAARRAFALGADGDTLNLSAGTHTLAGTLFLTKDIDVAGQGKGATVIDASGFNSYGIRVHADNVALSGFSLLGSAGAGNATYGIKVESGGAATERNTGFAITNVAISGSRKTGLDLNAVVGATIDGVSVSGVTAGNGISITDSADVVVTNSTTSGNAWGGLALYQSNNLGGGGSDQQLTGITVAASNVFGEANGLYLQASSTLLQPGTISIDGYGYTVRNPAHRSDGAQFTFFQKSAQNAFDYAASLASSDAGVVQGWSGSANDRNFYVGIGALGGGGTQALSLQTALDASASGDTINLASGTYAQSATVAGNRVLNFGDVVLDGLTIDAASNLQGNLTLASGDFLATGALTLTGATGITASNGNVSLGAVSGPQALTINGKAVTLGTANLASLDATGTSIATSGVTTTGAQSYTGATTLNGTYGASTFGVTGATTLGGATAITTTGALGLGAVSGAQALTLKGGAVTLGAANVASLDATGTSIATSGVTTTGAQSYTGATSLNGTYGASSFGVTGATTLGGATAITTTGALGLGAVTGAQALTLKGGAVTLGAANVASLDATGSSIATSGVTTTGAQSYTGATSLNGTYGASTFGVTGATTLGGSTAITTTGALGLGAVSGAQALTLKGGAVTLGAANLASLDATGSSIGTSGVTTTGAQSYTGATTLNGTYGASAFGVTGATTLGGATAITTTGALGLGAVTGAQALTLKGGAVTLGAANVASLDATGSSIATSGVTTTGAQSYTGATSLNGTYGASTFGVTGATTLGGSTAITTTGALGLGAVSGAQALTLKGGAVTLGAANLASLDATGSSIGTSGVTTTGAQSYTGATTLNGTYGASAFGVTGATTLGGATAITTTGALGLGVVTGAQALTLKGGAVTLGAANLASLDATGSSIATSGVTTTGAQSYTGATSLNGTYGASSFGVTGATTLGGATAITTTGALGLGTVTGAQALTVSGDTVTLGAANIGSLNATGKAAAVGAIVTAGVTTTGAQTYDGVLTMAGNYTASDFSAADHLIVLGGNTTVSATGLANIGWIHGVSGTSYDFSVAGKGVSLNNIGLGSSLGALRITADEAVLTGSNYRAKTIEISGGTGATARLTQVDTLFDTTATHGDIKVGSHLIGTDNGKQSVRFVTGTGVASDGDILLGNLGTSDIRLNNLSVTGGDFSAATVKLAGTFKSRLGGNQVFSSQTLDTLGSVDANVAGSESGPIVAGGSVSLVAGGSGTGSITAGGPVDLAYSSEVSRAITSQSSVTLSSTGAVTGSINATGAVGVTASGPVSTTVQTGGSANISSVTGVSSTVTAGGGVSLTSSQGSVSSQVNSGGTVNVNATGPVTGSITATGPVAVTATGPVSTTVQTQNSANISSVTGVTSNVTAGQGVQLTSSQGAIGGSINAGGPVNVTATGPVSTAVSTTGAATIASTSGVSSAVNAGGAVNVSATSGAVTGSITSGGAVSVTAQGAISASVSSAGAANVSSTSGGVSSTINAAGPVAVSAPGAVTSSITSGGAIQLTSNTPIAVQVNGGAVTVNAPGGQVTGVFGEITTDNGGSFVINDQPVIGSGDTDARQIITDSFLVPLGGTVGASGQLILPAGMTLALIGPAGSGNGRPPVVVNSVEQLGELLRAGYTAIIIDLEQSGVESEEELSDS